MALIVGIAHVGLSGDESEYPTEKRKIRLTHHHPEKCCQQINRPVWWGVLDVSRQNIPQQNDANGLLLY
jgi:hypothetical protein